MKKHTAVIIIPGDKPTHSALFNMILSALEKAGARILRPDEMSVTKGAPEEIRIHEAYSQADILIADVTGGTPLVMYEAGAAQGRNQRLLLLAESSRAIPFSFAGSNVIIYDTDAPSDTITRITAALLRLINNPPSASTTTSSAKGLFISYCHRDRSFLDRLLVHLKPLERAGCIDLWVDTRLRAGDNWKGEIERALANASVAVLIVTADFLASNFIVDNELPPLLKNAAESGVRIIPVIAKPCRFSRDADLRNFQAINDPSRALTNLTEGESEAVYDAIALEIELTMRRGQP
jgi:hypothetical protein